MKVNEIVEFLDYEKAENIEIIDFKNKLSIADCMIVCTGLNKRHVIALAEKLQLKLKHEYGYNPSCEGLDHGEWVLIDYGNILIHVFQPEIRAYYKLEDLWDKRIKQL